MPNTSNQKFSTYDICCIALVSAACVVGRTLFQFIPNFQPMTDMFILITLYKGIFKGIIVCILSLIITNIYMGMGIWTVFQIVAFSMILLVTSFIGRFPFFKRYLFVQIIFVILSGYLYGLIISYISVKFYKIPNFWVYYFQGVSFDSLHALGNGLFYPILKPIVTYFFGKYWNSEKIN